MTAKYKDFRVEKFGRVPSAVGSCDIWQQGSEYIFPTVAFQTQVVGGATDLPSSSGVHSVKVFGSLRNGLEVTEVATLNGATPVTLANSYYRVNRFYPLVMGSGSENPAQLTVKHTGSANLAVIGAKEGQTLQAVYTMPQSASGSIIGWRASGGRIANNQNFSASLRLQTRSPGGVWRTRDSAELTHDKDIVKVKPLGQTQVGPMDDIRLRIVAVSTTNIAISGGFDIEGRERR